MKLRDNAILPLTPNESHALKEGYFVELSSGKAAIVNAATDVPFGVILKGEGTDGQDSIAIPHGFSGTVEVKLDGTPGTVVVGTVLTVTATGTVKADPGSGDRVQVAVALQAGAADELIEAALIKPVSIAA